LHSQEDHRRHDKRALLPSWSPVRPPARVSALVRRLRTRQLAGPADVRWCYRLLLGREPDPHGERGYVDLIRDHPLSRDDLVSFFVSSTEYRDRVSGMYAVSRNAPSATTVEGLTIYVDPNDSAIGSFLRRRGEYEPAVTAAVKRLLRSGDTFVDCGASFGYFSALAGRIVGPEGSVVAFEPGPQNQSLLLLNLMANGSTAAEVHQLALSDDVGMCRYGRSGANGFISSFDGDPAHLATHDLVRCTTLDRVIGERRVDMMKVDVEGAEGRVFKGAEGVLRRSVPTLLFEFSPPSLAVTSGMSGEDLLQFLSHLGYAIDILEEDRASWVPKPAAQILRMFDDTPRDHFDLVAWRP